MTNSISEANLLLSRVKCALEGRAQAKAALEVKPRDLSAIMGAAKEITRQAETLVAVFEKMGGLETLEALVSRASQPVDTGVAIPQPDEPSTQAWTILSTVTGQQFNYNNDEVTAIRAAKAVQAALDMRETGQ